MRCPKCHYISFDSGERCRNCGYDFSLTVDLPAHEFDIEPDADAPAPLADFSLADLDHTPTPAGSRPKHADKTWPPAETSSGLELPLFGDGDADQPLVTPPAAPRPPLAVRRATPTVPRLRAPAPGRHDARLPLGEPPGAPRPTHGHDAMPADPLEQHAPAAGVGRRLAAAAIDGVLLLGLDLTVLYLTLKLAGLDQNELALLPLVPFLAFLAMLNGGYLIAFTASVGQTLGKMAFGIRVIDSREPGVGRLPGAGQAALRALASVLSIAPLGLGYLPALLGPDGRALHDRLADTRVVPDRS